MCSTACTSTSSLLLTTRFLGSTGGMLVLWSSKNSLRGHDIDAPYCEILTPKEAGYYRVNSYLFLSSFFLVACVWGEGGERHLL